MKTKLHYFRKEFLHANSWGQRKDGAPFYLLDKLNSDELAIAEDELMQQADSGDTWPVLGLGHIRSQKSLPLLYDLIPKTALETKIAIAHSIFKINKDETMIDIAIEETKKLSDWYKVIDTLYLLADFNDDRTNQLLQEFRDHQDYLIAYNATQALGLPTDEVVKKFSNRK